MTHSAFSNRSVGILSGMLSTSCMTTPQFSRRSCSLFNFLAYTTPATRVRHTAPTKYRFIADLHGHKFVCRHLLLKSLAEGPSTRFKLREGYALPDSQAGHFRGFELRILFRSDGKQDDPSRQREAAEYWWNRKSVVVFCSGMDRPDINYFFLMGVIESLIGKAQRAQYN